MKAFETILGPKQEARFSLVKACKDHNINPKKIFTLPSKEALCVKTFKKYFKNATIRAVEYDKNICKILNEKGIDFKNCTINEYIEDEKRYTLHHDLLFFDYYGSFSINRLNDIKLLIKNDNITHKGKEFILGVTFQKNPRVNKKENVDFFNNLIYNEKIHELFPIAGVIMSEITSEFEQIKKMELINAFEYKAQEKSTEMLFYVFKITK